MQGQFVFPFFLLYLYELMNVNYTYCNHFATDRCQTVMLYALNLYSEVCHLFLRKVGRKKRRETGQQVGAGPARGHNLVGQQAALPAPLPPSLDSYLHYNCSVIDSLSLPIASSLPWAHSPGGDPPAPGLPHRPTRRGRDCVFLLKASYIYTLNYVLV